MSNPFDDYNGLGAALQSIKALQQDQYATMSGLAQYAPLSGTYGGYGIDTAGTTATTPLVFRHALQPQLCASAAYICALRGFLTGIVLMMKRTEIRAYSVHEQDLRVAVDHLVRTSGFTFSEQDFGLAMGALNNVLDVTLIPLDEGEEVRLVGMVDDPVTGGRRLSLRIISPGDKVAREMARIFDGKLQAEENEA